MRSFSSFLCFMLLTILAYAQNKASGFYSGYQHTISDPNGKVVFYLHQENHSINVAESKRYYWYSGNQIHATQGGYSGRLLDGLYTSYYHNKSLRERGTFKNGLKIGQWKDWSVGGELFSMIFYRSGLPNGRFVRYDSLGNKHESGRYKDGKLHGILRIYSVDSVLKKMYHNGVVRSPKHRGRQVMSFIKSKFKKKNFKAVE